MKLFLIFVTAAVGTYLIRISGIVLLGGKRQLSDGVKRTLTLIAPAALAAVAANSLLLAEGGIRAPGAWHYAAIVAVAAALWRKSMGITIAIGGAAFAVLLAFGL